MNPIMTISACVKAGDEYEKRGKWFEAIACYKEGYLTAEREKDEAGKGFFKRKIEAIKER